MPERFENAHNEYLQYFITIGPMGLIAYVAFLVLQSPECGKVWKHMLIDKGEK
jgi:O-antigen ligase